MDVAVDETRHHAAVREVDDFGPQSAGVRWGRTGCNLLDSALRDAYEAIRAQCLSGHLHERSGVNQRIGSHWDPPREACGFGRFPSSTRGSNGRCGINVIRFHDTWTFGSCAILSRLLKVAA